jgi:hypothetical protein
VKEITRKPKVAQPQLINTLSDRVTYEVAIIEKINGEPVRVLKRFDICPEEKEIEEVEILGAID